jgi:type IV pilus assembly protein PilB
MPSTMNAVAVKPSDGAAARPPRDPRLQAALAAVPRHGYAEQDRLVRELPPEALGRIMDELALAERKRFLVVNPRSGYLPAVFAKVVGRLCVAASEPASAATIGRQLAGLGGCGNVEVVVAPAGRGLPADGPFDAILVVMPAAEDLPPELLARLAPEGRALVCMDEATPPRRMLRVRRDGAGAVAREVLELPRYLLPLGDLLIAAGVVLPAQVEEAMVAARQNRRTLGAELLATGAIREEDLYRGLAEQRGLVFSQTRDVLAAIEREVVQRLPRRYLDHYHCIPIRRVGKGVQVVTTNIELPLWELCGAFDGAEVVVHMTTPSDLQRIWNAIELGIVACDPKPARAMPQVEKPPDQPVEEASRAASTMDALLQDAVGDRASDLHIEFYESGPRVRFRIDGCLHDIDRYRLPHDEFVALVNVIKIAANMDIAERRLPQGGRIQRRANGLAFDLRVQTHPSLHGEHVVIRILPQNNKPPSIEDLGFPAPVAERYLRTLQNPQGLVLVVGPTGSGKSTTLYAGLDLLARDAERKVITVEDPIEYSIPRVQQTQINTAVGVHFADAMRAFVREDPDVILVGEIRDPETALEAIRAAQTGHLVLSTLHCNDTVDAVQRLLDLGMHANSIASELTAVLAQRLARRVCAACRTESKPNPAILAELFPAGLPAGFQCFDGRGCARCSGTGTRGRIAVIEFLPVGPAIRKAISRRVMLDELRELAQGHGLVSLRDSALELVQKGAIPLSELWDVLSAEQMAPPAGHG